MFITVDGIKIFYERNEGEGTPIVLLHGWGGSHVSMSCIYKKLAEENRSVVNIDFPGFGGSDFPHQDFTVFDYAKLTEQLLTLLKIEKCIALGHSFGGRIALILAATSSKIEKMVIVDGAGVKPHRGLKYFFKVLRYKIKKKLGKNVGNLGSADFLALPPVMRPVFIRVVNGHLDKLLCKVKVPTLIIWGRNDKDTPMYMAKKMAKKIKDSGLVVLENAGHYSYLDQYDSFIKILFSFIKL